MAAMMAALRGRTMQTIGTRGLALPQCPVKFHVAPSVVSPTFMRMPVAQRRVGTLPPLQCMWQAQHRVFSSERIPGTNREIKDTEPITMDSVYKEAGIESSLPLDSVNHPVYNRPGIFEKLTEEELEIVEVRTDMALKERDLVSLPVNPWYEAWDSALVRFPLGLLLILLGMLIITCNERRILWLRDLQDIAQSVAKLVNVEDMQLWAPNGLVLAEGKEVIDAIPEDLALAFGVLRPGTLGKGIPMIVSDGLTNLSLGTAVRLRRHVETKQWVRKDMMSVYKIVDMRGREEEIPGNVFELEFLDYMNHEDDQLKRTNPPFPPGVADPHEDLDSIPAMLGQINLPQELVDSLDSWEPLTMAHLKEAEQFGLFKVDDHRWEVMEHPDGSGRATFLQYRNDYDILGQPRVTYDIIRAGTFSAALGRIEDGELKPKTVSASELLDSPAAAILQTKEKEEIVAFGLPKGLVRAVENRWKRSMSAKMHALLQGETSPQGVFHKMPITEEEFVSRRPYWLAAGTASIFAGTQRLTSYAAKAPPLAVVANLWLVLGSITLARFSYKWSSDSVRSQEEERAERLSAFMPQSQPPPPPPQVPQVPHN